MAKSNAEKSLARLWVEAIAYLVLPIVYAIYFAYNWNFFYFIVMEPEGKADKAIVVEKYKRSGRHGKIKYFKLKTEGDPECHGVAQVLSKIYKDVEPGDKIDVITWKNQCFYPKDPRISNKTLTYVWILMLAGAGILFLQGLYGIKLIRDRNAGST